LQPISEADFELKTLVLLLFPVW